MGKKPYPKRISGLDRSSEMRFENTIGIDPKRIGGKKVKKPGQEVDQDGQMEDISYKETVLYVAPVIETPIKVPEIKPSFGENFMRGFWNFVRGERLG